MRKLMLRFSILCFITAALVYGFGGFMTAFWQHFGNPSEVRSTVQIYLMVAGLFFFLLYLIKKVIFIVLILLAVIVLLVLMNFDILHLLNLFG